jgi:hypothetical protein
MIQSGSVAAQVLSETPSARGHRIGVGATPAA